MTADFHYGCEVELGINANALDADVSPEHAVKALSALAELLKSQGAR
jgi:phosphocarrier protein